MKIYSFMIMKDIKIYVKKNLIYNQNIKEKIFLIYAKGHIMEIYGKLNILNLE